jgi:hypothetical protein
MSLSQSSSYNSANTSAPKAPYFPADLQDGKVCEQMLIERLRSYGWRAVENP